jgi:hypothetical protein
VTGEHAVFARRIIPAREYYHRSLWDESLEAGRDRNPIRRLEAPYRSMIVIATVQNTVAFGAISPISIVFLLVMPVASRVHIMIPLTKITRVRTGHVLVRIIANRHITAFRIRDVHLRRF